MFHYTFLNRHIVKARCIWRFLLCVRTKEIIKATWNTFYPFKMGFVLSALLVILPYKSIYVRYPKHAVVISFFVQQPVACLFCFVKPITYARWAFCFLSNIYSIKYKEIKTRTRSRINCILCTRIGIYEYFF